MSLSTTVELASTKLYKEGGGMARVYFADSILPGQTLGCTLIWRNHDTVSLSPQFRISAHAVGELAWIDGDWVNGPPLGPGELSVAFDVSMLLPTVGWLAGDRLDIKIDAQTATEIGTFKSWSSVMAVIVEALPPPGGGGAGGVSGIELSSTKLFVE